MLLSQNSSNEFVNFDCFPKLQPLFQFRVSVGALRDFCKQQAATIPAQGPSRDHAARNSHCRGSSKIGEQLPVLLCEKEFPNRAVWKWTVIRVSLRDSLRVGREMVRVGLACRHVLMASLSSILKDVAHRDVLLCLFCNYCNDCNDCLAAIDWCRKRLKLPGSMVEVAQHFLATNAGFRACGPCAP